MFSYVSGNLYSTACSAYNSLIHNVYLEKAEIVTWKEDSLTTRSYNWWRFRNSRLGRQNINDYLML